MKRTISAIYFLLSALILSAAEIYVVNRTGWSDLHLYSYIDDHNGLHGGWPGATPTRTETINGVACPVFDFSPATAGEYFLIFNSGSGAQIRNDFAATELRDYYLIVTTTGCTEITRDEIEPEPEPEPVAANEWIIYEANERVFASSKAFNAIRNRLDQIQSLGVNVLWLMPIHPIGSTNSVGSPYCVKDFKAVNPSFGTLSDLQDLVNDAHGRNMRVIIDWVANHTAWDNKWYINHPEWYTAAQTSDERNWNDVTFLNYDLRAVRDTMIDAMTYWVNLGIDGFRCDYAQGVPDDFWAEAIRAIRAIKPDAIMLAETSRLQLFEAGFDWMYSWSYLSAIQNLYKGSRSVAQLYSTNDNEMSSTPEGKLRMRYITNHDAASENANKDLYKTTDGMLSAACLTYFLGGIPLIYSSQEVGYLEKVNFFSNLNLNWNANPAYQERFVRLMQAYVQTANLRGGRQLRHTENSSVASFSYTSTEGTLWVVVNTTNSQQTATVPATLNGQTMTDLLTDLESTLGSTLPLSAYECRVYSIGHTTALEQVDNAVLEGPAYDVLGRRVRPEQTNGVVIINGQKVIRNK